MAAAVIQIAQRVQDGLHRKSWRFVRRGDFAHVAVVGAAREFAEFV